MPLARATKRWVARAGVYAVLAVVCAVMLAPVAWTVTTSLKDDAEITAYPPRWVPETVTLAHYAAVIRSNMPRYYFNSIVVSIATIVVTLFVASHGAYAVSRYRFRGKSAYLLLVLSAMMMPGVATLVPVYTLGKFVGLLDTYTILVLVYSVWLVPETVWILRAFFNTVPSSLDQAAMVDGYSRWYAFYRIVLPLSKPGLASAAIMVFVYVWNEFILALTFTSSDRMRTVQVGLHYYVTVLGIEWGELTAAVVLALIPVIAFFLFFQRQFVSGMTAGGLKG